MGFIDAGIDGYVDDVLVLEQRTQLLIGRFYQ
jgi:hypothetical protein